MKNSKPILQTAKETILLESSAIANLANLLDKHFEKCTSDLFFLSIFSEKEIPGIVTNFINGGKYFIILNK